MQEQTAPGARTMHIKNGWNFSRLREGGVKIHQIDLKAPEHSDNAPLAEIVMSDSEWQSIIARMSAYEDSARAFAMAKAFHQADPILNFGMVNAVGSPIDNEASKEAFLKHQAEFHA